ncbi:hypothetical protein F5Y16DRAFT_75216 [Xylariaceae sp. FL0255]|nr:hypothetical protein F5Y16DRAFT_75216 [Xylariaceae sp. FL0255]
MMAIATDTTNNHNGYAKMNDKMNGANGHAMNGHARKPIRTSTKKQPGLLTWAFSLTARLVTWYSIFTILFRCPASLQQCDDASPAICKPYFHVQHTVAPHITPYYDSYAAPYVDLARPYYGSLDRIVISPTKSMALKYGGPRVAQIHAYGQAGWEKNVQPQIIRYQALAKAQYDQAVAPHVGKATAALAPYYDIARTNALQTYHEFVVPAYTIVQPYAMQGYDVAYAFTKDTAVPTSIWAWNKTYVFLDATIWPHVRDVYVLKVEPQLVRIGERLGRYKTTLHSTQDEPEYAIPRSTFVKPTMSVSSTSSAAASISTAPLAESSAVADDTKAPEATPVAESEQPSDTPKSKEQIREDAAREVAEDLELWEGKFTKVAEEGALEIEDRVHDISTRLIQNQANVMGKSLLNQLETGVNVETTKLKTAILRILQDYKDKPEQRDAEIIAAVRGAGLSIKNKAQNIRDWRQQYEQETEIAVTKAAQEHFTILDQTRDLALQKIGMKWAWMDGVTYKHWKSYHKLREQFDEWTEDLKRLITTHPGLAEAQKAGAAIEDEGMAIAHEAAEELVRLKQVAAWKVTAEDFSDEFDSTTMQAAAEKKLADAAEAEAQAKAEAEAEAEAARLVAETKAAQVENEQSGKQQEPIIVEPPSDVKSAVADRPASDATNAAEPFEPLSSSVPVDGPEQMEETLLEASDLPIHTINEETTSTTVKSALFGAAAQSVPTRKPILDDEVVSSASSMFSVAQSNVPASITSAAQAAYTAAIAGAADQYFHAISAISAQIQGEPKPAHEELLSSVSKGYFSAMAEANSQLNAAMDAASKQVYGTPTAKWMPEMPTMPSVDWERVQSIAQQNFDDSVQWASEQYESAKVAIGAAEPTPSTYLEAAGRKAEKLADQAKHNYFAGVGMAHARYSEFLSAASTAMSSLTATPTPTNLQGSASSVASVASGSASSIASAASDAASSVVASAGNVAAGAKDTIDDQWNRLVSQVSSQVYGAPTPTPWYENLYAAAGDYASQAGEYAASATDVAADQISTATSVAGDYAASATSAAALQYAAVSSLVSELIAGKEPTFTESVFSRLGNAYTSGLSSASSVASAASATIVSAASEVTDAAGSGADAASEMVASATDKVKETVQSIKDEL